MPTFHPSPQKCDDADDVLDMPKFVYLMHLSNLLNCISLVHTSIFRYFQYVTEVRVTKFKDLRKCVKRVPIAKNRDLFNASKHLGFLTTETWEKFRMEMFDLLDADACMNARNPQPPKHPLSGYDRKYILSKYELTYQQLKIAKNQVSRIIQCNQIVMAFYPGIMQNWSGFIARVPKLIETTLAFWPLVVPHLKLSRSLDDEEVGCSASWVHQMEFFTEIIEKTPTCFLYPSINDESDSSDSDDSECGWDPPSEERVQVMKAIRS